VALVVGRAIQPAAALSDGVFGSGKWGGLLFPTKGKGAELKPLVKGL